MFNSSQDNERFWPLSRALLQEILADHISDSFVAERVWERLGYRRTEFLDGIWEAGTSTPKEWLKAFPQAPAVITQRQPSVQLTRSIPKEYKQLLKQQLDFEGYRIGELYPRRTRRATAVNWLLSWLAIKGEELPKEGPLPKLLEAPLEPTSGHPGDPLMES